MEVVYTKPASGFSLVELIIVIALIGVISAVVTVQWQASIINLGAEAKQLASDIRYTQSLAMTKGTRYYLIKQSSTTYQIMNAAGTPIVLATGSTTMTLNSGITFGTLTNLPNNLIAYDGNGIPYTTSSSPGTALASTATIPLIAGSNTKTINISPQTGRISIT